MNYTSVSVSEQGSKTVGSITFALCVQCINKVRLSILPLGSGNGLAYSLLRLDDNGSADRLNVVVVLLFRC